MELWNRQTAADVCVIGDFIVFLLKYCLFFRVFFLFCPQRTFQKPLALIPLTQPWCTQINSDLADVPRCEFRPDAWSFPPVLSRASFASFCAAASRAGQIIIRFCGAWRDVNLQSESGGSGQCKAGGWEREAGGPFMSRLEELLF